MHSLLPSPTYSNNKIMLDYDKIINTFYPEDSKLRDILLTHSRLVAEMAQAIAEQHAELCADSRFVYDAAMLHDIGITACNAPGIECHGNNEYIRHGILGAAMLRDNCSTWGLSPEQIEPYARVCERHTGTGLTKKQIQERMLPLPPQDLIPETMEEKIICYADKFFSKTRPEQKKTLEHVLRSLQKFGEDGVEPFSSWHRLFHIQQE